VGDDLPELSRPKPGLTRRRRETPSRCDGRPVPLRGRATPGRSGRHRRFARAVAAGPRDRGLDVPQGTGRRRNDGWAPSRGSRTGTAGDREGRDLRSPQGGRIRKDRRARGSHEAWVGDGSDGKAAGMSRTTGWRGRAWRPHPLPVERAGSAGPGAVSGCEAGPPAAGSSSRLPGGHRPRRGHPPRPVRQSRPAVHTGPTSLD